MKRLFIIASMLIPLLCNSQTPIKVDTITVVDNSSKEEMFVKVSTWIAQTFNSAQDVVQYSDKESGVIVCKGVFHHEYGSRGLYAQFHGFIDYTLSVKFKEDRYRITV